MADEKIKDIKNDKSETKKKRRKWVYPPRYLLRLLQVL